jgi:hypothetical protein
MRSRTTLHPDLPATTRLGWAWEFLRRNPEYRRLYNETQQPRDRLPAAEMQADLRRWGVMFPGGPQPMRA